MTRKKTKKKLKKVSPVAGDTLYFTMYEYNRKFGGYAGFNVFTNKKDLGRHLLYKKDATKVWVCEVKEVSSAEVDIESAIDFKKG